MYWDRAVQICEGGPVRFLDRLHNAAGGAWYTPENNPIGPWVEPQKRLSAQGISRYGGKIHKFSESSFV